MSRRQAVHIKTQKTRKFDASPGIIFMTAKRFLGGNSEIHENSVYKKGFHAILITTKHSILYTNKTYESSSPYLLILAQIWNPKLILWSTRVLLCSPTNLVCILYVYVIDGCSDHLLSECTQNGSLHTPTTPFYHNY